MENIDIKKILEIIFNYFKEVFAFWYPEEAEEVDEIVSEFEELK